MKSPTIPSCQIKPFYSKVKSIISFFKNIHSFQNHYKNPQNQPLTTRKIRNSKSNSSFSPQPRGTIVVGSGDNRAREEAFARGAKNQRKKGHCIHFVAGEELARACAILPDIDRETSARTLLCIYAAAAVAYICMNAEGVSSLGSRGARESEARLLFLPRGCVYVCVLYRRTVEGRFCARGLLCAYILLCLLLSCYLLCMCVFFLFYTRGSYCLQTADGIYFEF